ncbi:putative late blight resistance protein homolog R1A-10 [Salvia miltiorrhiza]|uniref:putative late blight resistance protein homolog R1A-10 n=1 Tax=Salvia miltiorrhiza TaxID=226208 RepID=UPI0025ACCF15|nr:putative late blight resistance protein homolog R1A-10 [Salvia miltiorrhiza]XP_057785667.1 putative late blight resistance protein homolog R1A-10 [Salvia miltiorrhiza]
MAAYGAATSLKNTIRRILQSSRMSLVSHSPQILQPAYDEVDRLQKDLLKLDDTSCSKIRTKVNAADERIKEAVWEFEDLLKSHILHQILPQLQSERDHLSFFVDLQNLQYHVDCFVMTVKMMKAEYMKEMKNMPEEEGESIPSRIDFGGMIESEMVELSHHFEKARDYLLEENNNLPYSIIGMAGVGKTTLAKHIFEDPSIQSHFEFRAWVKVGRKWESDELLRCVLAQVDPNAYQMLPQGDDDKEKLVEHLEERLKGKKCLIVLDDVWDTGVADSLMHCLQEENIVGSIRFLLTSRQQIIHTDDGYVRVGLLNEKESKELLGKMVFGEEGFPAQLEELGEEIAWRCEGLPLMIVTVAELLSKADKTPKYWTEVLKQHSSIFMDAYNQISKVLFPSYDYLPQHLKMIFLYMGAFRPYIDMIRPSMLMNLFNAEGFLELFGEKSFEDFFNICLDKLSLQYHLILDTTGSLSVFRKYRMHSCWQHLCKVEASRIKFMHVLQSCDDVIKDQRCLCAHSNSLFGFKQVYDSIKSDCESTARSLLCFGCYHPYPVPIHAMGFKLLRVLFAFDVRFYHIPVENLKLVCLRYISLTYNGDLPPSISNFFQLQVLVIARHTSIKKRGVQSYMPVQIWDMQELEHLDIWGSDLPTPNTDDATLNKLISLNGVSANSCTREVLKRIPNLKHLGIDVELKPYDDDETNPLSCLSYISQLQNLDSLKYDIKNPETKYEFNTIHLSMFPSSLTMLCLSGLGYPWKYMNGIGLVLPNLLTLVLESYAFQGREWEIKSGGFLKLIHLQIEDTDLVQWRPQRGSFPVLEVLIVKHCYKLQQLDWPNDHSLIKRIGLVDCNPLAVACANQLKDKFSFELIVESSF